jgi:hypothetical protein
MIYLSRDTVREIVADAIIKKLILCIKYQHLWGNNDIVIKEKAPFDLGTTNPKTYQKNKDILYAYCFQHHDEKTGQLNPIVHGINALCIISIEDTGKTFDPIELTKINFKNNNYDYRQCRWALVPNRKWY